MGTVASEKVIQEVVEKIVKLARPSRIIQYNTKYDMDGELSSFKLCIVGEIPDKRRLLSQIFDQIDCDVPFDVLLYTDSQFEQLREQEEAFASRVDRKGRVLYGR